MFKGFWSAVWGVIYSIIERVVFFKQIGKLREDFQKQLEKLKENLEIQLAGLREEVLTIARLLKFQSNREDERGDDGSNKVNTSIVKVERSVDLANEELEEMREEVNELRCVVQSRTEGIIAGVIIFGVLTLIALAFLCYKIHTVSKLLTALQN